MDYESATSPQEHRRKRVRNTSPDFGPRQRKNWHTGGKANEFDGTGKRGHREGLTEKKELETFAKEQTRLNQIQEAEQMRDWVSKEDEFVLKQSKKKAKIRVREGRAKFIDWLAVTLSAIDKSVDLKDDDAAEQRVDIIDPAGIFEGLSQSQLHELGKDIGVYLTLEADPTNRRYWSALAIICHDFLKKTTPSGPQDRSTQIVSGDIDRLLSCKTLPELGRLETQVSEKLRSDEPIDVEYWEQLLGSIGVYKAKAELNQVYSSIIESRLSDFRQQQAAEAKTMKERLAFLVSNVDKFPRSPRSSLGFADSSLTIKYSRSLDPEPFLKLRSEDKAHEVFEESDFLDKVASERQRIQKLKYVPFRQLYSEKTPHQSVRKPAEVPVPGASRFTAVVNEDFSQATTALYEREVARGVQENEEIFAGEEEVSSLSKHQWVNKYRPRKPRYFNRVQMGYEWNKYNQTHYDHDNPPPKVVQGYKFNIFYPDLIDKSKAPTYRIERENGRKRGQSFAPAGEEDTCLIRFISGPPYEDLAFRIVDKEWDYSAKRERGFRSSFDKGILQLHFQFKKVYYRK